MIEREDVQEYTAKKQELQIIMEQLFAEMMEDFDLAAFLADPNGYTRAALSDAGRMILEMVRGEAESIGEEFAIKAEA